MNIPNAPFRGAIGRLAAVIVIAILVLAGPWLMGGARDAVKSGSGIVVEVK